MNRFVLISVWIMNIIGLNNPIFGQISNNIQFKQLDVDKGLSQNSVVSIAQDSTGFLWFATQDGLNKYSGDFNIFQKQFEDITKQTYNKLGKVFCDISGQIWIVSKSHGLECFDQSNDTFVKKSDLINVDLINQDASGRYWIMTSDGVIVNTKSDFFELDTIYNEKATVFFDFKEIEGNVHIATSTGLLIFKYGSLGFSLDSKLMSGISISSIACNDDSIYYGTFGSGLFIYSIINESLTKDQFLPDDIVIYKIIIDAKNRVWVGTYGQGLYVIDKNVVHNFKPQINGVGNISYHDILDIYEDESGVIWIGTDGGGVNYFDKYIRKFKSETIFSLPSNVSVDVVRSIYSDQDNLYCGTSGKGLTVYNEKSSLWKTYKVTDGLVSDRIMAIQKDEAGKIWLGNQFDGLSIISDISEEKVNVTNYLEGMSIWCLSKNGPSQYWCGTQQSGLILFDRNKGTISKTMLRNAAGSIVSIRNIVKVNSSLLYIGTDNNGVFQFNINTGEFKHIAIGDIPVQEVKTLLYHNNHLFVGSNGSGIFVLDGQTLDLSQHITTDSGLKNNVVYGIYNGEKNDYWISTNRGISKLNWDEKKLEVDRNFVLDDGLQSYEFNTGAHFKSDDGYIYFGGINGINWFHPNHMPINESSPKTIISGIDISGVKQAGVKSKIIIPHDKNNFNISLATSQLSLPSRNKYKYRLKDFENEWNETNSNNISYMNVGAGSYEFEVLGSNYDGTWSDKSVKQHFEIQQIWYFSWWFKTLVMLALGYLLFVIYQSKKKRLLLLHKSEQQKLEADYLQRINETRSRFFTNITHELLTPLTVIRGICSRIDGNENLKSKIANNSNHLIELVNQVLLFSKSEVGYIKHEPCLMNVIPYLKYITDSYNTIANDKHISLNFYSELTELKMDIDPDKVKTVLGNVIMNALKYTPMYGKVIVVVKKIENKITVIVNDNGIGMDEVTQENIFDRFYQSGQRAEGGAGVGLSIVKELCEIMDVGITVNSQLNEGTEFVLSFEISTDAEPLIDNFTFVSKLDGEHIADTSDGLKLPISSSAKTVLLVEDNKDVAEYIMQVLMLNYNCVHVKNGQEALDYAKSSIPDIIITDVMMPVMDGMDMVRILKNELSTNHIPIIVLTAKNTEQDKLIAIQSGANAFLTKPFSEAELLIRIEALLAEQERNQWNANSIASNEVIEERLEEENGESSNIFLSKIYQAINSNLSNENLSIQQLCEAVNLERTQVYRKLKAITGKSASQLIKEVRLEKAKELISTKEFSISEIAYACGYKDVSYFSKSFKKHFGIRPSDV